MLPSIRLPARLLERQAIQNQYAADGDERPAEPVGRVNAVIGLGDRGRGKEGGVFTGAGDLLPFDLLHSLVQKVGRPLVEHEAIDHTELDSQQKNHQAGQEILVAVKIHGRMRLSPGRLESRFYYRKTAVMGSIRATARALGANARML